SLNRQRTDLEETFGESFDDDDEDDDDNHDESHRLLSSRTAMPQPPASTSSASSSSSSSNLVPPTAHHRPRSTSRPAVLPVTNDGVFSNMAAKPETEADKLDETPPAYEEAAADSTPPYWQTTVIAPPGMGDIILVEGMPVGNLFNYAWNLLGNFQFVGFMLTYLLHTSHAAKYGFYIRSRKSCSRFGKLGVFIVFLGGSLDEFEYSDDGESDDNKNKDSNNGDDESSTNADIIAYLLMLIGWFIIIRANVDYIRARKMEKIIAAEPSVENMV
ncbi:hypothetical protein BCR43DRAFT_444987, partial [Syncephalastrum racemosum]